MDLTHTWTKQDLYPPNQHVGRLLHDTDLYMTLTENAILLKLNKKLCSVDSPSQASKKV